MHDVLPCSSINCINENYYFNTRGDEFRVMFADRKRLKPDSSIS